MTDKTNGNGGKATTDDKPAIVITNDEIDAVTKAMDTESQLKWDGVEIVGPEHGHLQDARSEARRAILAYRACKAMEEAPKAKPETAPKPAAAAPVAARKAA